MLTMSSIDTVIIEIEHAQRIARADRRGWKMQAGLESRAQPRRRPGNPARPAGVVAFVVSLLATWYR